MGLSNQAKAGAALMVGGVQCSILWMLSEATSGIPWG